LAMVAAAKVVLFLFVFAVGGVPGSLAFTKARSPRMVVPAEPSQKALESDGGKLAYTDLDPILRNKQVRAGEGVRRDVGDATPIPEALKDGDARKVAVDTFVKRFAEGEERKREIVKRARKTRGASAKASDSDGGGKLVFRDTPKTQYLSAVFKRVAAAEQRLAEQEGKKDEKAVRAEPLQKALDSNGGGKLAFGDIPNTEDLAEGPALAGEGLTSKIGGARPIREDAHKLMSSDAARTALGSDFSESADSLLANHFTQGADIFDVSSDVSLKDASDAGEISAMQALDKPFRDSGKLEFSDVGDVRSTKKLVLAENQHAMFRAAAAKPLPVGSPLPVFTLVVFALASW